jgi:hypothetical protein
LYHPEEVVEERGRKPERRLFSVTTNGAWAALEANIGWSGRFSPGPKFEKGSCNLHPPNWAHFGVSCPRCRIFEFGSVAPTSFEFWGSSLLEKKLKNKKIESWYRLSTGAWYFVRKKKLKI